MNSYKLLNKTKSYLKFPFEYDKEIVYKILMVARNESIIHPDDKESIFSPRSSF